MFTPLTKWQCFQRFSTFSFFFFKQRRTQFDRRLFAVTAYLHGFYNKIIIFWKIEIISSSCKRGYRGCNNALMERIHMFCEFSHEVINHRCPESGNQRSDVRATKIRCVGWKGRSFLKKMFYRIPFGKNCIVLQPLFLKQVGSVTGDSKAKIWWENRIFSQRIY